MEYHQHPDSGFYTLADTGMKARKQPLLMIITTAGKDLNCPCYLTEYEYCSNLLNPDSKIYNDRYYADIYEAEDKNNIDDENEWKKANPIIMSYREGIENMRDSYKEALDKPELMVDFKTKSLNIWLQQTESSYMNIEKWKNCQVKEILEDTKGCDVFVGFDMSAKIDLTSVAFIIKKIIDGIEKYYCWSHSFIPNEEKLRERIQKDKMPYDSWVERGYITITNTPIVDQQQVIDYVEEFCDKMEWNIKMLCFDPANASKLMMDLEKKYKNKVVEVYQSHKSLNESTAGFREQVYEENIIYEYNPVLNYAMTNAVIKQNNGLIKIDKDATNKRIDPVDAILCAFKLALYHEVDKVDIIDEFLDMDWDI